MLYNVTPYVIEQLFNDVGNTYIESCTIHMDIDTTTEQVDK